MPKPPDAPASSSAFSSASSLQNEEARWAAVAARDASADGRLFYGVTTMGVYCRPSCPSRRPLRKNARFFDSAAEAEAAGFRPCKRCRPAETAPRQEPVDSAAFDRAAFDPAALDWAAIAAALDERGFAITGPLFSPQACRALAALYDEGAPFRKTIAMARHGFGQGEYKYFNSPLPEPVAALRAGLYAPLAEIANRWAARLGEVRRFPATLDAFLGECAAAGQTRPTPLLLRYGPGDYNRLHQDVYGDLVFPIQLAVLLDAPGRDFDGGEFVLTEQRPRQQSRASVAPLQQGCGVLFPVCRRPVRGARGDYAAAMRHGVSEMRSGRRHVLGVIFHNAR